MSQIAVTLTLIMLTGPDHQVIEINPEEVVSLRAPRAIDHMTRDIRCIVFTTDGKFIGVEQSCRAVGDLLRRP